MYRFVAVFALVTLIINQSVSQQPTFIKFIKNDIPINALTEQTFSSIDKSIKHVYVVKLQSCQISYVDVRAFQQMQYLRVVSLPYNQIRDIPRGLFANNHLIKQINFANNEITMLQDGIFANLKLVEMINFAHNKIVRVEPNVFRNQPMLKSLDMSYNYLKNMWPDMFMSNTQLQKLQLDGNKIDRIGDRLFAHLEELVYLDLNRNQINETDRNAFSNLKSLVMLNMEHNYVHHFEVGSFDSNINLRALNLNENNLQRIDSGLFTKLMKLEHLTLKGNMLRMVGDDVFPRSSNLSTISLCRNQLMALNATSFEKLYGLRTLCVADNPFYCDCNIMEFHEYYMNNENITKDTIICYQPERLGLRSWSDINSRELSCDSFEIKDIFSLPLANETTKMPEYTPFPPFAGNSLDKNDFENENMTMERITREEMQFAAMKVDLGGTVQQEINNVVTTSPVRQNIVTSITSPVLERTVITSSPVLQTVSTRNSENVSVNKKLSGIKLQPTPPTINLPVAIVNNSGSNDGNTRLPDCFNNKPAYFDEQYNKNFVEWRARFLGEFLIMYTSAKHASFYPNNDIYKRTGPAMLVPNQNGFTFMDPTLSQNDWKYINDYLEEFCSITNSVLNGETKIAVHNYAALEEVSKLIDSLGTVVKEKLKDNPNPSSSNRENIPKNKQTVREVHRIMMSDEDAMASMKEMIPNLPAPNMTDGRNLIYYIINARAEGQGHVNILTGK